MKLVHKGLLILLTGIISSAAIGATDLASCKVKFMGSYLSERVTEEHQYADQFDFWTCGQKLFGFYYSTSWLIGSPNEPSIKSLFDGSIINHKISIPNWIEFSGKLSGTTIKGTFNKHTVVEFALGNISERTKANILKKFSNYSDWEKWAKKEVGQFNKKYCLPPNCVSGK